MTLHFAREVVIIAGIPVIGTVTVEVEGQLDRDDELWQLDLTVTGFGPEDGRRRSWGDVQAPCEAWLAANKARVEKKALKK